MGKKKVIKQSEQEVLAEEAKRESATTKNAKTGETPAGKKLDHGKVYINATYNNTTISVTNRNGDVIAWATAGSLGFSGPKKATPFAATKIVATVAEKLKKTGLTNIDVVVKGVGSGRDSAVRSLINHGFNVLSIKDVTPIPHNGPKPTKPRRV